MDYRVARILRILIYILIALVILALLVVAFNALRRVFSGTSATSTTTTAQVIHLNDYKTNGSSVRFVMDGPIEAPEQHETTTITISATQSVLEVVKGYSQAPVLSQAFPNNQASYNAFLDALSSAGFTNVKESTTTNRGGACPLGNRYSYQILLSGALKQDTWSASCGAKQGTFGGSVSTTQQLFRLQIPSYSKLVSSVQ
jgi:hypothetical protein